MTQSSNEYNNKAWSFLKSFKGDALINLVAIDPLPLQAAPSSVETNKSLVIGITDNVTARRVFDFIEEHNGKHNLYFMVNTPSSDAPDNKLKKEHVEFINAVWIDADPIKDKTFKEERKRLKTLMTKLKDEQNPPTFIIDSGGGYQAFWCLKEPVKLTDESQKLYEGYSRALAEKYDTDRVQNIDRIMRVPYTWNIPTKKKLDLGRTKALSCYAETGGRYE